MSRGAELAVALAVRILPHGLRERYREEWGADLRDASGAGIAAGSIARGALLLALTVRRPLPLWVRNPDAGGVRQRGRLALALALSAALLGFTRYLDVPEDYRVMSELTYLALAVSGALIVLWMVCASVAALFMVAITRQMPARVRFAVIVLSLVSIAAQLQLTAVLDVAPHFYFAYEPGTHPLVLMLVAAAVIVTVGAWAVVREPTSSRRIAPRRSGTTLVAAVSVAALGSLALMSVMSLWSSRMPLNFGRHDGPDAQAIYDEWVSLRLAFEDLVTRIFVVSTVVVALLVIWVVVGGLVFQLSRAGVALLAGAAAVAITLGNAGLSTFFELSTVTAPPSLNPFAVLAIARLALVTIVLVAIGGVRFTRVTRLAPAAP